MIIVKIRCDCGKWVRIRTMEDSDSTRCWNCGRTVSVSRKGGKGARIVGKCGTKEVKVNVEYEE